MIERSTMDLEMCVGAMPDMQSFEDEIKQLQQDGLLDLTANELPNLAGIEATDMGSLLEQFEEASRTLSDCDTLRPTLGFKLDDNGSNNDETPKSEKVAAEAPVCDPEDTENGTPSKNVLEKIRAGSKRKAAIMLPMGMPSKRGRGRATAMPANCALPKIQRIINGNTGVMTTINSTSQTAELVMSAAQTKTPNTMQNLSATMSEPTQSTQSTSTLSSQGISLLTDNLVKNLTGQQVKIFSEPVEVNPNYYKLIIDHDYCQNVPHIENKVMENAHEVKDIESAKHINSVNLDSCNLDMDDSQDSTMATDSTKNEGESKCSKRVVTHSSRFLSYQEKLKQSKMRRNYRKQREESPGVLNEEKFFDKIPSYYTALSIPNKQQKRTKESNNKVVSGAGITLEDYFERNPSPPRDPTVFNKLPAYYSCFTNSTKYDSSAAQTAEGTRTPDKSMSPGKSSDASLDNSRVCSSGYSSRSHSPSLVIDSRQCSRSPSLSRSISRSPSRSRSRGRKRSWRRERKSSYSSHSRSSSRSSYYSRSSSSRSRSRSRSSSSDDSSRSSSRSPSRPKWRTRSQERRRMLQKQRREQEKARQMEERRIIYVGRIPDKYTRHDMKKRFGRFGEIEHVQLHFREHGDNYGFVTFSYTCDAYAAVEKGNDIPGEQEFDLCFGGRRQFCKNEYEDLDGELEVAEEYNPLPKKNGGIDFDELLRQAQKKIQK